MTRDIREVPRKKRLQVPGREPFLPGMDPVQSSSSVQDQYAVAMLKKQNDAIEEQGKAAVELIQAAAAPATASSGNVGRNLHVVA